MARLTARALALFTAALPALLASPLAAEQVEETPLYRIVIRLDPRLAAYPALDARMKADALRAQQEFRDWGAANDRADRPYDFSLSDVVTFASADYVSVLRTVDFYTGGAHGNRGFTALTWDVAAQSDIGLGALVAPEGVAAMGAALRDAIAAGLHNGAVPDFWAEAVATATAPDRLDAFTIAADASGAAVGVDVHFAPYEIAPYSSGSPTIRIEADAFAPWLTDRGARLFGR